MLMSRFPVRVTVVGGWYHPKVENRHIPLRCTLGQTGENAHLAVDIGF